MTKELNFKEVTIEQGNNKKFVKGFEDKGDILQGIFKGHEIIDFKNDKGEQKIFVLEIDGEAFLLPSNYELTKKLEKVEEINGVGCIIQIEIIGFTKIEGGRKVKNFKVLVAE